MQENPHIQGSYLPPIPDFASHSPFGGPDWFEPKAAGKVAASCTWLRPVTVNFFHPN